MKSPKNKASQSTDVRFNDIVKALLESPPQHKKKTKKELKKNSRK